MKIALVRMAIGDRYYEFYDSFYEVTRENFFPEHEVDIHVFTDYENITPRKNQVVHKVPPGIMCPEPCFRRYEWTLEVIEQGDYDFVFQMDVDNFVDMPPPHELLQDGFSIIHPTTWGAKYGAGFWGGITEFVRRFCMRMKAEADKIFNFEVIPTWAGSEEFLYHCEKLGCKVRCYSWGMTARKIDYPVCLSKWIVQIDKNQVVCRKFQKKFVKFEFFSGPVLINERMRVILCFEKRSHNHYGRYEEIEPGKLKITWQEERYGVSYLNLNATKDNN